MALDYTRVTMTGLPSYGEPGEPVLPFKLVKILIPQGKDVESIHVYPGNIARVPGRFNVDYGKTLLPVSANTTVQDNPARQYTVQQTLFQADCTLRSQSST